MQIPSTDPKVIIILGRTASGKSKLAVELALTLGSVIISADAFQVYKDFSVASDKILDDEMRGVPHFGIDIVPASDPFTVKHFLDLAIPIVENELAAGRSPIIVGGTHMYIEKLLFTSRLDQDDPVGDITDSSIISSPDCEYTHSALSAIDPVIADRIHPNDSRRISRAIDYFYSTGTRLSDVLSTQHRELRWRNLAVICKTTSDSNPLADRIRQRVMTKMVETGTLRLELERIKLFIDLGTLHWNKGLLQAIGYREFQSFTERMHEPDASELFNQAVEQVIRNTVKYSKQQQKWITRLNKTLNIHFVDDSFETPAIVSLIHSSCNVLKFNTGVPQWSRDTPS